MNEPRPQRILRQHLRTEQLLGVDSVPLGATPQRRLDRGEDREPAAPPPRSPAPPAGAAPPPAPPALPGRQKPQPPARAVSDPAPLLAANLSSKPLPAGNLSRAVKLDILERMDREEVKGCTRCPLAQSRTQTVFGEGDPDARIMFIGEGPGADEDAQGRPFVGRSGQLLTKMIEAMGLQREQVFIANVVKCRPPGNRPPTPEEAGACSDYLHRQIATIRPRVIVALGGSAAKLLLGTQVGITKLRGQWQQYTGLGPDEPPIPLMPTFHPSYVLRAYTPENRRRVWDDLQKVMRRVEEAGPATAT